MLLRIVDFIGKHQFHVKETPIFIFFIPYDPYSVYSIVIGLFAPISMVSLQRNYREKIQCYPPILLRIVDFIGKHQFHVKETPIFIFFIPYDPYSVYSIVIGLFAPIYMVSLQRNYREKIQCYPPILLRIVDFIGKHQCHVKETPISIFSYPMTRIVYTLQYQDYLPLYAWCFSLEKVKGKKFKVIRQYYSEQLISSGKHQFHVKGTPIFMFSYPMPRKVYTLQYQAYWPLYEWCVFLEKLKGKNSK